MVYYPTGGSDEPSFHLPQKVIDPFLGLWSAKADGTIKTMVAVGFTSSSAEPVKAPKNDRAVVYKKILVMDIPGPAKVGPAS